MQALKKQKEFEKILQKPIPHSSRRLTLASEYRIKKVGCAKVSVICDIYYTNHW